MENRNAYSSGDFLVWKRAHKTSTPINDRGFTPILITAIISMTALVGVLGWQVASAIKERGNDTHYVSKEPGQPKNIAAASRTAYDSDFGDVIAAEKYGEISTIQDSYADSSSEVDGKGENDFSQIGKEVVSQIADTYSQLQQIGGYTSVQGERVAGNIAESLRAEVSFTPYASADFITDPDTSYKRMLSYRSDLQKALEPLLANSESELDIFARYIDTGDKYNLEKLEKYAQHYRSAAANMKEVGVPRDALTYHMAVANSLVEFAATLESMSRNAGDSMATLALLRAYNEGEQAVLTSFNSLARYQRLKSS